MKKNILIKFILIIMVGFTANCFANEKILITVNQFISHVALDAAEQGLKDALLGRGILPDKADIIISNAQGNITNSVQISKYHASLGAKFMVAIATPAAQTNLKAIADKQILAFVAVTDPEVANLTGHKNVIGVSDDPPIKALIQVVRQIFPNLKKIGIIYNPGEVNSVKMTSNLESILKVLGIEVKKVAITTSNDVRIAIQKLIGEVEIIYLPQDNSVVSAIDSIVSITRAAKIPLIANDPTLVKKGVFIALGSNYFKSGQQLGYMIADLIEGKEMGQSIQSAKIKELSINKELAKEFEVIIPENIKTGEQK